MFVHISVWHVRAKRHFLHCHFPPISSSLFLSDTRAHTDLSLLDTLVPVSSWRGEACLSLCVQHECVCHSIACCSALLCWSGHVATLKLLSESPVKLLRSSTTPTVSSGNPFASCSLHTPPIPASFPLSLPHMLSPSCLHLLRLSAFPLSLSPLSF